MATLAGVSRDTRAWTVRDVEAGELAAYIAMASRNFLAAKRLTPEVVETRRRQFVGQRVRSVFDGGRPVGSFRSFDVELPVPGAVVTAEAISSVTVAGTHRRRGVLTAMMSDDLESARERGDAVLALLIASEGEIYGRFGFGPASEHCTWTLDTAPARFLADPVRDGELRLELAEEGEEVLAVAPALYEQASLELPGALPRTDTWWRFHLALESHPDEDPTISRPAVIARDATGAPVGVLTYRAEERWQAMRPESVARVQELIALTPAAHLALWRFLAEIDLVRTVVAGNRPVSEPLPWLVADRRVLAESERADFHWVRLLDVPAALRARRYSRPGQVVLAVDDPRWPLADRLRLEVAADGTAEVTPTSAAPDVSLDVAALGSAYLGQLPLTGLAAAGRVTETTPGAVRKLSAMLTWPSAPLTGHTWF